MPCNFPGGGSGGGSKERAGEEPKEGPTKSESKPAASFRTIILVFYIHRLATSLVMLFQVTKDIASLLGDHGLWEGKLRDSGVSQPWWSKIDINMYPCVLDSCKLILLLLWTYYFGSAPRNEALLKALLEDLSSTVDVLRNHRHALETEADKDKVGGNTLVVLTFYHRIVDWDFLHIIPWAVRYCLQVDRIISMAKADAEKYKNAVIAVKKHIVAGLH